MNKIILLLLSLVIATGSFCIMDALVLDPELAESDIALSPEGLK